MFTSLRMGVVVLHNPSEQKNLYTQESILMESSLTDLNKKVDILIPGLDGQEVTLLFKPNREIFEIDLKKTFPEQGYMNLISEDQKESAKVMAVLITSETHKELFDFIQSHCVELFGDSAISEKFTLVPLDPEYSDVTPKDPDFFKYLLSQEKIEALKEIPEGSDEGEAMHLIGGQLQGIEAMLKEQFRNAPPELLEGFIASLPPGEAAMVRDLMKD